MKAQAITIRTSLKGILKTLAWYQLMLHSTLTSAMTTTRDVCVILGLHLILLALATPIPTHDSKQKIIYDLILIK